MLNRNLIERLKTKYPKDTAIELEHMEGEDQMLSGLKGKVLAVDDIGQIHVEWENGSTLALDVEADRFHTIETIAEEQSIEMSGSEEESQAMGMSMQ